MRSTNSMRRGGRMVGRCWGCLILLGGLGAGGGCASRSVTFIQADYINTAMHRNRAPGDRTGEPLEVAIVCVYPSDLARSENGALKPESNITSDVWYQYRPRTGQRGAGFSLPPEQIYLLTDETGAYGTVKGKRLRGAKQDGRSRVKVAGIKFSERGWKNVGTIHKSGSVIYVFPKFIGPDGLVLPSTPVKFHPPGSYGRDLQVEIGVEDPDGAANQYVRMATGGT